MELFTIFTNQNFDNKNDEDELRILQLQIDKKKIKEYQLQFLQNLNFENIFSILINYLVLNLKLSTP